MLLADGINADQMLLVMLQPPRRGGVSRYRVAAQDYGVSVSTFGQPYARAIHTLGSSMKASLSAGPCEDFTIPAVKLLSGLSTGVKHGTRLSGGRPLSM